MKKTFALIGITYLVVVVPAAWAERPEKPLVDRVRDAIDRGVRFLREEQRADGSWEVDAACVANPGGWSSLAMLAMLNAGVPPDDPAMVKGLKWLRSLKPARTYVVGLQTMVYTLAGQDEDKERIQKNADWLLKERMYVDGLFGGWTYSEEERTGMASHTPDNSNTQYALLGLHEAHLAHAKIDDQVWQEIREFYKRTQHDDGGWGYTALAANGSTLTMSVAGLCGLLIAGQELDEKRETALLNGTFTDCGHYRENPNVIRAINYIARHFLVEERRGNIFYNLYGLERAGRLTGLRFFGDHDWYREGCEHLVRWQDSEGFWIGRGFEQYKTLATSFAILFLSKGRTPIMISKLVHGPDQDWNNDHNDARNLVDFASRELFKRQPLAWQVFDAKRGIINNTHAELLGLAGELMQSPIAYFNGHEVPQLTHAEEDLLKEYVDQGGFILAEACCGRAEFDRGFRDLMQRLFPDTPLQPLAPDHPVWRSHFLVAPGSFKLEGIDRGCKTVVIYAPQDMSCYWESNQFGDGRAQQAFRLGANIIAYATGMEVPKPRLSVPQIIRDHGDSPRVQRGYLKAAQLRYEGDWQPAPHGLRNLLIHLQDEDKLLVSARVEPLFPSQQSVLDHKFLYLHGRQAFSVDEAGIKLLRSDLQTGGLLFADACCGKEPFDKAFRALVNQLYPGRKLEKIPVADELYSAELNGRAITRVRCRREPATAGNPTAGYVDVPPALEGIRIGNRWVIIYSKYDIGCALERHQSSDCLGHDYASAIRLGTAAVRYALNR
jgi:hypothetical protein